MGDRDQEKGTSHDGAGQDEAGPDRKPDDGAGGDAAVKRMAMRKAPDLSPRRWADQHPDFGADAPKKEEKKPEHSSRSDATSWDSQPDALKEVLTRSWGEAAFSRFGALSDAARSNLVYTYNRMISYGIWPHVKNIKLLEPGEKPTKLGPINLWVAGTSASVVFEVYDGRALRDTMLKSGKFGKDEGASGLLHPGQTSMREWSTTTEDGLHLSIGGGTEADAHIDKKSPTNQPARQTSQMDLVRSLEHHWQEVWPEFLRAGPNWIARIPQHVFDWLVDKLHYLGAGEKLREAIKGIPRSLFDLAAAAVDLAAAGTTFKPGQKIDHPDPSQREKSSDIVVVKEYRFGDGGKEARRPAQAPPAQASLTDEQTSLVSRAVSSVWPGIVKPTGGKRASGDYSDSETIGQALAGKILHTARANGVSLEIDLGPVYHRLDKTEVEDVKKQLATIGKAAREALAAALAAHDETLSQAVLGVKSGHTQLGPSPVWFPLH